MDSTISISFGYSKSRYSKGSYEVYARLPVLKRAKLKLNESGGHFNPPSLIDSTSFYLIDGCVIESEPRITYFNGCNGKRFHHDEPSKLTVIAERTNRARMNNLLRKLGLPDSN
jgi:hypothetical protein